MTRSRVRHPLRPVAPLLVQQLLVILRILLIEAPVTAWLRPMMSVLRIRRRSGPSLAFARTDSGREGRLTRAHLRRCDVQTVIARW